VRAKSVSNIDLQSIRHGDRRIRAGLRIFDRITGEWYIVSFVAEVFEDRTIVSGHFEGSTEGVAAVFSREGASLF
jgi:hypothetical protein